MTKTIFWNVDTQYDFMRDDESHHGGLAVPDARSIEPNLERITRLARSKDLKIVSTADWHTEQSAEFSATPNFVTTFPPHCLERTKGAEYIPATEPRTPYVVSWQDKGFDTGQVRDYREIVLLKDEFDVFAGNLHATGVVRTINPDRAIVYGVATNYCVNYAVQGLLDRGVEVYVVKDAIKEIPNCDITEFMEKNWTAKGVKYTTTDSIEKIVDN